MAFKRVRNDLNLNALEKEYLRKISDSRTKRHSTVIRAKILLHYSDGMAINRISKLLGVSRPMIERCVDKALSGGVELGLKDLYRVGRPSFITVEAKTWVTNLACKKPLELGYSYEMWTISLLAKHIRDNAESEGHPSLSNAGKSLVHGILKELIIKPHKTKGYLEKRDEKFEEKMVQVLTIYKEVQITNEKEKSGDRERLWSVISYDEKPGIQAIDTVAPDLPPVPGKYSSISRDPEYKRHGTLSLLAGIDLHNGCITGIVRERHRSKEFTEFLSILDKKYPPNWKLRVILDNHSAHISKETMSWLKNYPNRFEFIFTPKHGSWLNLIEIFFSKMARSFLRGIRTKSKEELKKRIEMYLDEVNRNPVVFRWKYKMDEIFV